MAICQFRKIISSRLPPLLTSYCSNNGTALPFPLRMPLKLNAKQRICTMTIFASIPFIFGVILSVATASEVEAQVGNVETDLLANVHCFLFTSELKTGTGTNDVIKCLSAAWPNATIPYIVDPSVKNSWREKIEKITSELSRKTCLKLMPVTESITVENNSRFIMRLRPGNSTTDPTVIPPLNVNISSWRTMTSDLLNSLCIFRQGAQLDTKRFVRYNDLESRLDCLSRNNSGGGTSYISMLDAERLNALYNCGGCHSYRFIPNVLQPSRKAFQPYSLRERSGFFGVGVCRGLMEDQLAIGKLKLSRRGDAECSLPYGDKEHLVTGAFEVLALNEKEKFQWLPILDEPLLPPNAIPAGRTLRGDMLYMGKCSVTHEDEQMTAIGKIHDHDPTVMYYAYNEKELGCSQYDIFVCKGLDSRQRTVTPSPPWNDTPNFIFYYPPSGSMAYKITRRRNDKSLGSIVFDENVPICFGRVDSELGFPYYLTLSDGKRFIGTYLEMKGQTSKLLKEELDSAHTNKTFHWYINRKGKYFQFINRQTGMVLDSSDQSNAYIHIANGGSFQDWKIEPWTISENSTENNMCQRISVDSKIQIQEVIVGEDYSNVNSTEERESYGNGWIMSGEKGIGDDDDSGTENSTEESESYGHDWNMSGDEGIREEEDVPSEAKIALDEGDFTFVEEHDDSSEEI